MNQQHSADCPSLEERLKQKLEQFQKAEEAGQSRTELSVIYRELKDLHYQLTFCRNRRFTTPTVSTAS